MYSTGQNNLKVHILSAMNENNTEIVYLCYANRLYAEFQCSTMPGTGQKVCDGGGGGWWCVSLF